MMLVLLCGVCGRGFPDEPGECAIRAHTAARDEHGDQHDGEPWRGVTLKAGDEILWAPHIPHAAERARLLRLEGGRVHVESIDRPWLVDVWNDVAGFVEACYPGRLTT